MRLTETDILVIATSLVATTLYLAYARIFRDVEDSDHLPPGPKPIPVLNNLHQLPLDRQEETFAKWARKYGDIVYAKFGSTPTLIVNSLESAQDLMITRSRKYSDRPRFVFLYEMMQWGSMFVQMSSSERLRKYQTWMRAAFQDKGALSQYWSLQQREIYTLLSGLFEAPDDYKEHFKRYTGAILMEITYGHRVTSLDDHYVSVAERTLDGVVSYGPPGTTVLDFLPHLKYLPAWFPGATFKRHANCVQKLVRQTIDAPFKMVQDGMTSGNASHSLAASLLEEIMSDGPITKEDETDVRELSGILYGAGTETTASTLAVFLLAMVLNPDVYAKAQAEMDRVIGSKRLPDFDDRKSLPYLECVLKETHRWRTVVPLGIPHKTLVHDEYRGFDIPAGTVIIPNIWAISQDTQMYPEPISFRPERYWGTDQTTSAVDPRMFAFGFGRRICPGRHIADANIWLAMANMIATLSISRARDRTGVEITPPSSFTSGFTSRPIDFPCTIKPRSESVVRLVSLMSSSLT
ncbi:cytochrome P450 [Wolfiporia cocos MD-104 SS10]|uniref:Cytochrome P450 n=1 Tax=Wolfiporia cocos (strain MD-104) TaxID=742152 RepID=A0A2H3JI69_WOLCO|nr:cytochrome P450 [Wolfiporia cocos MD-104 SS10]